MPLGCIIAPEAVAYLQRPKARGQLARLDQGKAQLIGLGLVRSARERVAALDQSHASFGRRRHIQARQSQLDELPRQELLHMPAIGAYMDHEAARIDDASGHDRRIGPVSGCAHRVAA